MFKFLIILIIFFILLLFRVWEGISPRCLMKIFLSWTQVLFLLPSGNYYTNSVILKLMHWLEGLGNTAEARLTRMDTLVSRQFYLWPPHKTSFILTPIQTLYFYIPVSSMHHFQTPFSCPEGVRSRELNFHCTTKEITLMVRDK